MPRCGGAPGRKVSRHQSCKSSRNTRERANRPPRVLSIGQADVCDIYSYYAGQLGISGWGQSIVVLGAVEAEGVQSYYLQVPRWLLPPGEDGDTVWTNTSTRLVRVFWKQDERGGLGSLHYYPGWGEGEVHLGRNEEEGEDRDTE